MNTQSRNANIKRFVLALIVFVSCLLQFTDSFLQKAFGFPILYTLPVIVCISMFQGEVVSMCCALCAGLFWDSVSAQSVCSNTVFLVVSAFLISYAVQKRLRNFFVTALLLNFFVIFSYEILNWVLHIAVGSSGGAAAVLFKFCLPSFIVTGLVSIPIYFFTSFVHKKFSEM